MYAKKNFRRNCMLRVNLCSHDKHVWYISCFSSSVNLPLKTFLVCEKWKPWQKYIDSVVSFLSFQSHRSWGFIFLVYVLQICFVTWRFRKKLLFLLDFSKVYLIKHLRIFFSNLATVVFISEFSNENIISSLHIQTSKRKDLLVFGKSFKGDIKFKARFIYWCGR